jgi:exopolyphosphatase/guanosine-5'-triphosphate,3'-diphosphate pyrophosphatase
VYTLGAGQLRILASTRAALRLVETVDDRSALSDGAVERTLEALADFQAIALGAGAGTTVAIATAALRDASNGVAFVARVERELGITIKLIDAATEARYGFAGAVHNLPIEAGLLFDLGGGSLQISTFRERRARRDWSFPLGALRLSHRFLQQNPPTTRELRDLRRHVQEVLARAGLPQLQPGERLVGTGGTLRNLAKVDRREREYPIERVHGYTLTRKRLRDLTRLLSDERLERREAIPGLSDARADSIVGGAVAIERLMDAVDAPDVLVSGDGVREGLALSLLAPGGASTASVRETSMASITSRFDDWHADGAERRRQIVLPLLHALDRGAPAEIQAVLLDATFLLDIGRSVDYFDRYEHVADMILATDLGGYSHRDMALLSGLLHTAGNNRSALKALGPLVKSRDRVPLTRAAMILSLADDLAQRCKPGEPVLVTCRLRDEEVVISIPTLLAWRPRQLVSRFQRVFGRRLIVQPRSWA